MTDEKKKNYEIVETANGIITVKISRTVKKGDEADTLLEGVKEVGQENTIVSATPLTENWLNGSRTVAIILFVK
jgi:hypothetical protein